MKKVSKYPEFKKEILETYCKLLQQGEKLPAKAKNHALSKNSPSHYKGFRDFHVAPDICVIYQQTATEITLYRIGKHNNLELTEDI